MISYAPLTSLGTQKRAADLVYHVAIFWRIKMRLISPPRDEVRSPFFPFDTPTAADDQPVGGTGVCSTGLLRGWFVFELYCNTCHGSMGLRKECVSDLIPLLLLFMVSVLS